MVWRGDIEKHYENVDKAYDVLKLIDNDELSLKDGIRDVIVNEMRLACKCVIDWIGDESNEISQKSAQFLENLELGYDILVIIDVRTFIYKLLDKSLSELLK